MMPHDISMDDRDWDDANKRDPAWYKPPVPAVADEGCDADELIYEAAKKQAHKPLKVLMAEADDAHTNVMPRSVHQHVSCTYRMRK